MEEIKIRMSAVCKAILFGVGLFSLVAAQFQAGYSQTARKSSPDVVTNTKTVQSEPSLGPGRSKITLRLTFDDGVFFNVTQIEGAVISITRNGKAIGIVAHVDAERGNQIAIRVLKVIPADERDVASLERGADVPLFELDQRATDVVMEDWGVVKIQVVDIKFEDQLPDQDHPTRPKQNSELILLYGRRIMNQQRCCVTCSGIVVCGCAIDATCGSCCSGDCC